MAKGKYEYWKTDEGKLLLSGWARDGLSDVQIAENMGISRSTLNEWKKKHPDISDTLKKGKEVVDIQVENSLLKLALEGNTTAIIFWLKNRRPEKWRDKPVSEKDNSDNINENIKALANLINNPQPNRKLSDLEGAADE